MSGQQQPRPLEDFPKELIEKADEIQAEQEKKAARFGSQAGKTYDAKRHDFVERRPLAENRMTADVGALVTLYVNLLTMVNMVRAATVGDDAPDPNDGHWQDEFYKAYRKLRHDLNASIRIMGGFVAMCEDNIHAFEEFGDLSKSAVATMDALERQARGGGGENP